MAASPAPNPSLFSSAQGVSTHGGEHYAVGRDVIHNHFYPSGHSTGGRNPETDTNAPAGRRDASTRSSGPLFRFPDISRFFRTRTLDVDIISIVEAEHSSLINGSSPAAPMIPKVSEMYLRLMLTHRHGYPLYYPGPRRSLSAEYRRRGIRIGDVGRITPEGAFDFLFNVDSSQASLVNPPVLPRGFETVPPLEILVEDYFPYGEYLLSGSIHQTQAIPITYKFSAPEGSVLQLPEGAMLFEAENADCLYDLATRHAQSWYEYMAAQRSRDIPNGSLYLVTGCIKARDWGIGVLYERPSDHDHLAFISEDQPSGRKYGWRKSGPIATKVGPTSTDIVVTESEEPNQCVFIRGYKIALGKKIWKKMKRTVVSIPSQRGNFSPPPSSVGGGGNQSGSGNRGNSLGRSSAPKGSASGHVSHSTNFEDSIGHGELDQGLGSLSVSEVSDEELESVVLTPTLSVASPPHPSDVIISMLAHLEPEAEVILVHDNEWCSLLPNGLAVDSWNLDIRGLLENAVGLCLAAVGQNACVSLVKKLTMDFTNIGPQTIKAEHPNKTVLSNAEASQDQAGEKEAKDAEIFKMTALSGYTMGQRPGMAQTIPNSPGAVIATSSRRFPNEIIEEILNHLDFRTMMRCRIICSAFRELIDSSPYFHWQRVLALSGMEDGGNYPLPVRRQMLERHQQGWTNLQWTEEQRKKSTLGANYLWEFKGNVYAECDSNGTAIHLDKLASKSRNIEGRSWRIDVKSADVENFTMDPAQDLLVIVQKPSEQQSQYIRQIFLWTLSSGDLHPLAVGTHILTHASSSPQLTERYATTSICGESLCILFDESPTEAVIKVWNWKTGQVVTHIVSEPVDSLIFLSGRHIMFPSAQEGALIVVDFIAGTPERQRLEDVTNAYTFRFPPLVDTAEVIYFNIRSGLGPDWKPHPTPAVPFYTTRHDRLCVVRIRIDNAQGDEQWVHIIAPTSTFLSVIETAAGVGTCFEWPVWGPDGTRMIIPTYPDLIVYTAYGMRLVSTHRPEDQPVDYLYLYDFNQLALRWSRYQGEGTEESKLESDLTLLAHNAEESTYVNVTEATEIALGNIFQGGVETRLGYRINRWAIPEKPMVYQPFCGEDGIMLAYGQGRCEEIHMLTF